MPRFRVISKPALQPALRLALRFALWTCLAPVLASGARAEPPKTPTTLYIVRHAEKLAAAPGNADPSLSPAGEVRAVELEHVLRAVDLRAIYVTPYRRTRETAAPLAKAKKLTPVEVAPESLSAFAGSFFAHHAGQAVLLIGHSDTASTLLQFMRSEEGAALGDCDYDDLVVVTRFAADEPLVVQHLHYGATPTAPVAPPAPVRTR